MLWLILFSLAIAGLVIARRLHLTDEIHGVAVYCASSLAVIWGLAVAPSEAQISLGLLTLGGLQLRGFRSKA